MALSIRTASILGWVAQEAWRENLLSSVLTAPNEALVFLFYLFLNVWVSSGPLMDRVLGTQSLYCKCL